MKGYHELRGLVFKQEYDMESGEFVSKRVAHDFENLGSSIPSNVAELAERKCPTKCNSASEQRSGDR